jgi:hypothetical protein
MEDAVNAGEEWLERCGRKVEFDEAEIRIFPHPFEVGLLRRTRVVIREGVDPDDLVSAPQKRLGEVRADEARAACDEIAAHG